MKHEGINHEFRDEFFPWLNKKQKNGFPKAVNTYVMAPHVLFSEMAVPGFRKRSVLPQTKFIMGFSGHDISCV